MIVNQNKKLELRNSTLITFFKDPVDVDSYSDSQAWAKNLVLLLEMAKAKIEQNRNFSEGFR